MAVDSGRQDGWTKPWDIALGHVTPSADQTALSHAVKVFVMVALSVLQRIIGHSRYCLGQEVLILWLVVFIITSAEGGYVFTSACLSVCLSVG